MIIDFAEISKVVFILLLVTVTLYDLTAVYFGGLPATISFFVVNLSREYPIIAFALGMLMGHLFWPQYLRN